MKYPLLKNLILGLATCLTSTVSAQTDFTDADGTESFITTAGNWDNGLPIGQQGTITINATYNTNNIGGTGSDKNDPLFPVNGYDILHTDGTVSKGVGINAFRIGGGTTYVMNGATAAFGATRGIGVDGAGTTFTLVDGNADLTDNARDSSVTNGGEIIVNGGTMSHGRHFYLQSGDVTISGGIVTVPNDLGARNFHSGGDLSLNGGTISAQYLTFGTAGLDLNFGGTTAGSLVIENFGGSRANVNVIDIDFDPGTLMTMQLTIPVEQGASGDGDLGWTDAVDPSTGLEWAQALWETGRLSYNNDTASGVDILGEGATTVLTWAQAQVDLGDGSAFVFDSPSDTLSLTSGGGGDTTPPNWVATWPQVDGETANGATARGQIDEDGTAYFVVVPDAAAAPSVAEVTAGTGAGGSGEVTSGSIALTASTENTAVISGLSPGTAYDVYFVAEDTVPNLQAAVVKVDITTLSLTLYAAWSGGSLFGDDDNGDGLSNGLAFLLGAADPAANATGLLPTVSESGGNLVMNFTCLAAAARGTADLNLEYDGDLAGTWLSVPVPGAVGTPVEVTISGSVSFDATDGGTNTNGAALINIEATISDATESAGGKLFGRLEAPTPAP